MKITTKLLLFYFFLLIAVGCAKRHSGPPPGSEFNSEREYSDYDYRREYSGRYQ